MTRVRSIIESDRAEWARLREALWPGSAATHDAETRQYFETSAPTMVVFVAQAAERLVGFLELDFRKYAPGCRSSPVPFIEGWYVDPAFQRQGIGRALVAAAEAHARAAGYSEIASDTEVQNMRSIAAHAALGYEEAERVVSFRKTLVRP